jgi:nucleoside-diphosphate-sugar epimerase
MGCGFDGGGVSSLVCLGLGYCARHYVSEFGKRFSHIAGTARADGGATGDGKVEMIRFDGVTATPPLSAAILSAEALLISAPPHEAGDPVLTALRRELDAAPHLRTVVYLSTIGVYGDHGGGFVDEDTPTAPISPRGEARVAAENVWRSFGARRGIAIAVLRLAGIYGPGRNALLQVKAGAARRIDKPGQLFNRVHVADIAQAIDAAFAKKADGIFNLADDEAGAPGDPLVFAANLLGVAPPPAIPFDVAVQTMSPMAASFYAECRQVRNERLKTILDVRLRYPTYREGLTALYAAGEGR